MTARWVPRPMEVNWLGRVILALLVSGAGRVIMAAFAWGAVLAFVWLTWRRLADGGGMLIGDSFE